jgi:uncharacterized cupredoxin-like copper-binding protein
MRRIKTSVVVGAAVLLLSAVGCGDDDDDGGDEGAGGTEVDVVLSEFIIEPSEDTVDAGEVTFNLDNQGGETHEFVVVDAASVDDLPLDEDEAFDESTYGEDNVLGEVEDVESGATAELTVDMAAGDYLLLCNIVEDEDGESESHFAEGMHTEFTVE